MSEPSVLPMCDCKYRENQVCAVCQIWMPEINRLKGELEDLQSFKQMALAGKISVYIQDLERQISRYKEGVEVEGEFEAIWGEQGKIHCRLPEKYDGQRIRMLVMKDNSSEAQNQEVKR